MTILLAGFAAATWVLVLIGTVAMCAAAAHADLLEQDDA